MNTQLRHQAGTPESIGGQYKAHERAEADTELHPVVMVEGLEDWPRIASADHFGAEIHISHDGEGHYQVWGDPIVAYFDRDQEPDEEPWDEDAILASARQEYDFGLRNHLENKVEMFPELAPLYADAIAAVKLRIKGPPGLTAPDGWRGEF